MGRYRIRLKPSTARYPLHRKEIVEAKYKDINHCMEIDLEELDDGKI